MGVALLSMDLNVRAMTASTKYEVPSTQLECTFYFLCAAMSLSLN